MGSNDRTFLRLGFEDDPIKPFVFGVRFEFTALRLNEPLGRPRPLFASVCGGIPFVVSEDVVTSIEGGVGVGNTGCDTD